MASNTDTHPFSSPGSTSGATETALDPKTAKILPLLVAVSFFMQMLDTSILNTALPSIAADLGTSPLQMQAVVISYLLTVALFIPTSGWLTDHFGTRPVFMSAIALFTLGSLTCALSPTLPFLVASRILQGVGGALMVPVGRLAILRAFPRDQLVRILSFITIPGLMGPLVGPTLGGVLSHYASWHWVFLINIPVGLAGIFFSLRHMPMLPAKTDPGPFDRIGFILFSLFMVCMTLALDGLGELHLGIRIVIALAALGLVNLALYCVYALKAKSPLFSPALFAIRNFRVGILGNLFARLGNGAMPFLTPLLLQVGLGYNPVQAGLTMLPITFGSMIAKSFVDKLIKKTGYRRFLFFNTFFLGFVIAGFALIGPSTPYLGILGIFLISGIINSMQFTSMNSLTLFDLPDDRAGSGNSLLSVIMQLSMGMGIAFASAVLGFTTTSGETVHRGFQTTYLIMGAVCVVSSFIFLGVQNTHGYASSSPSPNTTEKEKVSAGKQSSPAASEVTNQ